MSEKIISIVICEVEHKGVKSNYFLSDFTGTLSRRMADAVVFKQHLVAEFFATKVEQLYPGVKVLGRTRQMTFEELMELSF